MLQAVNVYSVSGVCDMRAWGEVSGILVCQTLSKLSELCLQDLVLCLGRQ